MGRKADARRQSIVDMATSILIKGGPGSLVLRDVAERLGITHGNLQYYFPTKDALLVGIFDRELEKYTESMKQAVAATSTRQGRLAAIIDAGMKELKSPDTALWRMLMSMADHSADMAAILKKENDRYQAELVKELKHIAPDLTLRRRRHIARIIHAILDGLGIQFIYADPDSPDTRALVSEIQAAIITLVEAD